MIQQVHLLLTKLCIADPMYRLLHISVAVAFAQQLQQDLTAVKEKRLGEISLAAKWAPTPGSKLVIPRLVQS